MNALAVSALVSWLITEALAAREFWSSPGIRSVVAGHVVLTCCGLLTWIGFVLTAWAWLAWAAIGCLVPAVGLSLSAMALRAPDPASGPDAEPGRRRHHATLGITTDEMLARALEDETLTAKLVDDLVASVLATRPDPTLPRIKWRMAALVPAVPAITTVVLAVLAAISAG